MKYFEIPNYLRKHAIILCFKKLALLTYNYETFFLGIWRHCAKQKSLSRSFVAYSKRRWLNHCSMKIVSFHVKRARFQLGPVFHFPVRKMPRSLENDVLPFDFNQNFGLASATIFFIIMEKNWWWWLFSPLAYQKTSNEVERIKLWQGFFSLPSSCFYLGRKSQRLFNRDAWEHRDFK